MSKVTIKLQVTIPKAIAEQLGIRPGDEVDWIPAGDSIRVPPSSTLQSRESAGEKLKRFDEATERQRKRQSSTKKRASDVKDRGWRREDIYTRGSPR